MFCYVKSRKWLLGSSFILGLLVVIALILNQNAYAEDGEPDPEIQPPQAVRVVEDSITHNSVTLEWDFIDNDENDIEIYNENGTWITWGNIRTRTVGGFQPETTYRIYIIWNKDKDKIADTRYRSDIIEFTTLVDNSEYKEASLPAPLHFQVSDISEESISFTWTGSPGADGYDVYNGVSYLGYVWDHSNSYTYQLKPEDKADGTPITFYVAAQYTDPVAGLITSKSSNKQQITWGSLASPQDLQAITTNQTTVQLGWAEVAGATNYDVYQDGELIGKSTQNRFIVDGLTEGQTYEFSVQASNALWESEKSDELTIVPGAHYNHIAYYTSWSVYEREFDPEDIQLSEITHINYAFADICWQKTGSKGGTCEQEDIRLQNRYVYDGEIILGDIEKDIENFEKFNELKDTNEHLKVLVSVGGWSWSKYFSDMAATELSRRTFAQSAVDFVREYELDGLDIDWEYPVEGGEEGNHHSSDDKANFTLLMQTVRAAFDAAGIEDNKYYLLTIASGQGDNFVVNADLINAVNYLDFINIMTYDYAGSWESTANHNAPLYYDPRLPKSSAKRNNVLGGVNGHLAGGVPSYKLVLGLPFYGKAWSACEELGQYANCGNSRPDGSWEAGIFDYSDIVSFIGTEGYERYWNDAAKVAYLYNADNQTFITYNDAASMIYSAGLVRSKDLAGVMIWEISGDRTKELTTQLNKDLPWNNLVSTSKLAAPTELALVKAELSELKIQWNAAADATDYEVYVNEQYIGQTNETQYNIEGLSSGTTYAIHVIAVKKEAGTIKAVSASSEQLQAKTLAIYPGYVPATSAGAGETSSSPDGLTDVEKLTDGWIVSIDPDAAVRTIEQSADATLEVNIEDGAPAVQVVIPQAVIEALRKKGNNASLQIQWNEVTYTVPYHMLSAQQSDLELSLKPVKRSELLRPLMSGMELLSPVVAVDIVKGSAASGQLTFSVPVNTTVIGIVYDEVWKSYRSVNTTVVTGADGNVTVQLDTEAAGTYMVVAINNQFTDANMAWAKNAIMEATKRLLITGESEQYFGTKSEMTRAEFVTLAVRALNLRSSTNNHPFADVATDSSYAVYIGIALEQGLVQGKTPTTFDPNGTITRQEMAVIMDRILQMYNKQTAITDSGDVLGQLQDRDKVASYAQTAVAQLMSQQIMQGTAPTRFAPQENVTKGQAVVAMMRLLDIIE